jgi:hypothetical protein
MMPLEISGTSKFMIVYSRQIKTFLPMKSIQCITSGVCNIGEVNLSLLSAILYFKH